MADIVLHDVADQTLIDTISMSGCEGLSFSPWPNKTPQSSGGSVRLHDAAAVLIDETVCSPQSVLTAISRNRLDIPVLVLPRGARSASNGAANAAVATEGELYYVSGDDPAGIAETLQNRIAQWRRRAHVNRVLRSEFEALTERPKPAPVARPASDRFLELAPVGILFLDNAGQVAFANRYALNALRSDKAQVTGQNIRDLIPGPGGERLATAQEPGETPNANPIEIRIDQGSDRVRYFSVRVVTVSEYGDWASRMVILTDETANVEALFHMEALAKARSEFFATANHELRTPLNAIMGFCEMMQANLFGPLNEKYQGYTSDILLSARHLLEIVNDTLDIAKAESGKLQVNRSTVPIRELLNDCVTFIEPQTLEKEIRLTMDISPDIGSIQSDKRQLRQVIINLLSNAAKFTPERGAIELSAHPVEVDRVRIVVSDNGVGIAKDDIPRVLEAFGQARQSVDIRTEGTGLGLPLARKLTQLLGGTFELTSSVGQGTDVTIAFPRSVTAEDDKPYRTSAHSP